MKYFKSAIAILLAFIFSMFCYALPVSAQSSPSPSIKPSSPPSPSSDITKFELLPDFALPHDIPLDSQKEQALAKSNFPALQRVFDIFSWQSFLAVNALNQAGLPRWSSWTESLQIFRPDGLPPQDTPPRSCPQNPKKLREIYATSSVFSNKKDLGIADEFDQAFTSPLYDQNGKPVRYEIFINDEEVKYIIDNKLYNLDGQIEFSAKHAPVNFPSGSIDKVGSIELKLAWKELDSKKDIPSRFYTQTVLLPTVNAQGEPILDANGNFKQCDEKLMGLVGMHISHKTTSSPQWIWSTFEHIDNLQVNDLKVVDGKRLSPLFHDDSPVGETLPVNVPPIPRNDLGKPDANGTKKTQVSRPIPIPKAKQQLNAEVQAILKASRSPWQYYELIDTQWPTNPSAPSVPGSPDPSALPEAITNKSSGAPAPVYLTNSIMETYLQAGNQIAHFQENGFPFVDTQVFGTESCMGCHFSAGVAVTYVSFPDGSKTPVFGGSETGDFSWLLQLKANFLQQVNKPKLSNESKLSSVVQGKLNSVRNATARLRR